MPRTEEQTAFARKLRRKQTLAERMLWILLRDRDLARDKFRRQQTCRFIREAEGGAVGNLFQLSRDGGVDLGVLMAVKVGPDGGVGVEVLLAVCVAKYRAFAGRDDDWLALQPVAHLGERMPDV